jgi:hypothetical protein
MGGLGNQMFQYALGRRLALDRGVPLKLDVSWYEGQDNRSYSLCNLAIKADIASAKQIFSMKSYSSFLPVHVVWKAAQRFLPYYKRRVVKEQEIGTYDPNILHCPDHAWLNGYWQSEKYFQEIKKLICQDFSPRRKFPRRVLQMALLMHSNPNSVSIHIRRGDYLTEFSQSFATCSIDYYKQAVLHISAIINKPHFYIFSDDIEWAKNNLVFNEGMTFIEPDTKIGDFMDMYLMSQCRHHINANSSFSWWGAWLGEKTDSIVIAPNRWYTNDSYPKDTIPERWVKL